MNSFADLNNQLFKQIDRLASAKGEAVATEVQRTEAMCKLTAQVIDGSRVYTSAVKLAGDYGHIDRADVLALLGGTKAPKLVAAGRAVR